MTANTKKPSLVSNIFSKISLPLAIVAGLFIGTKYPEFTPIADDLSRIFLALLKLCVTPIILIAITLGIYNIMTSSLKQKSGKFLITATLFYIIASAIGVGTGILSSSLFKGLDLGQSVEMQQVTQNASMIERDWDTPIEMAGTQQDIQKFDVLTLVPDNIFSSLNKNALIQIILFAIIFGIAMAYSSKAAQESIVPMFKGIEEIFNKIFSVITAFLPLIIFCIIAKQASDISFDSLIAMMNFIVSLNMSFMFLFILVITLMKFSTKLGILKILKNLKSPIFLSLATGNNMIAMPVALKAMNENFNLDKKANELLIPLGIFIGKYGAVLYIAFATIFAATIYDISLTLNDYLFITFMSIFLTISSIGAPPVIFISFLAFIFAPLGIPFGTLYALLILVDLLIDPFRTLLNVCTNCAFSTLFSKPPQIVAKTQTA